MNFNEFNINILPEIERIIGIEVMDKERLYAALLSDEYLYINKEYILLANSHKLKKLGDSLLNLIKIEYIYRNITVDFNTLALIDTGTKKKIRNNIKFHLDIIDTLIKQGDKHKYNTDSYEILKTLLGVMYLEGNYESTKKIITKDVARVVDDFVINPKYDWYSIIKDWGTDNHAWIDYDIVEKEPFDNSGKIKMELNIFDKKEIGYGDSIREARIDSAYNYYKRYISEEDVKRYIPELKFENFKISGGRLPLLRKSDLEKITSIEVEDYWMLNECFVHESYIEENG